MPWTKTEYEHTITANGTSYNTLDQTNGIGTDLGTQSSTDAPLGEKNFQMVMTGTSATVVVEVRNGGGNWITAATKVFSSGDATTDFSIYRGWDMYRFNTSGFTATNIKVYVTIG